jgi:hypothetical protein
MILLIVAVILVGAALAWGPPIVRGWHLGHDFWTDSSCETRLGLQWCGRATSTTEAAP